MFSYLPQTLSIFSLPALEDLFLIPISIFSCVFPFFSPLPALDWRSFWASYPPPFSLGDLTSLPFALLSIWLYFLLCSYLIILVNVHIRQQKPLGRFRRRVWWQHNEENIVAPSITIRVSETVQRISSCATWQWTTGTEIILALKTIW